MKFISLLLFNSVILSSMLSASTPSSSYADTKDGSPLDSSQSLVMLLVFDDDFADDAAAVHAIRAGLSDLPVVLAVRREKGPSPNLKTLRDTTHMLSAEPSVIAVFHCQTAGQRLLHLYQPKKGGGVFETRQIEPATQESTAEMMAVIIRRTIIETLSQGKSTAEPQTSIVPIAGGNTNIETADGLAAPLDETPEEPKEADEPEDETPEETKKEDEIEDRTEEAKQREGQVSIRQRDSLESKWKHLFLEAALGFKVLSTEHPSVIGGNFLLGARLFRHLSLFAGYTWESPTKDSSATGVKLELTRHPLEASLRYGIPLRRLRLDISLALMADIVTKSVEVSASDFDVVDDDSYAEWSLAPMAKLVYPFSEYFSAFIGLGIMILLDEERLFVEVEGDRRTIHDPWPVQISIHLGLAFAPV